MLFKESLNQKAEEIRKYISVNVSIDFDVIKPYIVQAEYKYIKKVLGTAMYQELLDYYNSSNQSGSGSGTGSTGATPQKLTELLEFTQRALIHLAIYTGFDFIVTKISAAGAYRTESDKQKGLYQYQEVSLRNSIKQSGFDAIDDLLTYLEENKADFENWKNSSAYGDTKKFIINTTAEFDGIYSINESRLVFLTLKKYMRLVENSEIISFLCAPLYNEIKSQIEASNVSAANNVIIPHLQTAVAFLTVARAANEMGITWSDKGMYFEFNEAASGNMRKQQLTDADRITSIISLAKNTANQALENVRTIMVNNIADYPLYANSNNYNGGLTPSFDNTNKKTYRV